MRKFIEVEIDYDVLGGFVVEESIMEMEDFMGKELLNGINGVMIFVVGRDGNVNVFGGRVSVVKGNDGDVDVGSFFDGLGVGVRVGNDD